MKKTNPSDLLKQRKWKEFLMAIPIGKPMGYGIENANDIYTLRVRASQLAKSEDCDRTFSVTTDYDNKIVTVTAKLKDDGCV